MVTQPVPWNTCSKAWKLFPWKKFFRLSNVKLPLCNLRPFPLICCFLPVRRDQLPSHTSSFSTGVKGNKVFPQPPFLLTEQLQFPHLLLVRLVVLTLYQLYCPPLDSLQPLNFFPAVRGPKLNTGLKLQPHQWWVQGVYHLPGSFSDKNY